VVVNAEVNGKGRPISYSQVLADSDIPNNAQTKALCLASGDVLIKEIIFQKDGTNMTGPTNVEVTCNNVYGVTGLTGDLFSNLLAGFNANLRLAATAGGVVAFLPICLEDTKSLFIHGDDAVGAGGNIKVTIEAEALTDGANLT
jgi:hypothetical protein